MIYANVVSKMKQKRIEMKVTRTIKTETDRIDKEEEVESTETFVTHMIPSSDKEKEIKSVTIRTDGHIFYPKDVVNITIGPSEQKTLK